jgi:hypothetical protein
MKLIKETEKVGNDVYERVVGASLSLHELVEAVENSNLELGYVDEEAYMVSNPTEYEVFLSGKPIDASKITVVFYDCEDDKQSYYYCEATGDELSVNTLDYAKELMKCTKEELIQKLLD